MAKVFSDESYQMLNTWSQEIVVLRIKFLKLRNNFTAYPDSAIRLTGNWNDFLNQVSKLKNLGTVAPANMDQF
jgi:VanZ family protein